MDCCGAVGLGYVYALAGGVTGGTLVRGSPAAGGVCAPPLFFYFEDRICYDLYMDPVQLQQQLKEAIANRQADAIRRLIKESEA